MDFRAGPAALRGLSGGLGGFITLIVAQSILDARNGGVDLVRRLGRAVLPIWHLPDARVSGLASVVIAGALLGAPLGYLTRRLLRVLPRLLFYTLLLPALWLFVRAVVLGKLAPGLAAQLPFVPLLIGSLVHACCLAVVSPLWARTPRRGTRH